MGFINRIQSGWNAFLNKDPTQQERFVPHNYYGYSRPDRPKLTRGVERTIANSIFNRIALDVAAVNIRHCRLDANGRYLETIEDGLHDCFNLEANIDQTGRDFIKDIVLTMFDEGCVAIVPTDMKYAPTSDSESYPITQLRTGKITEWYPFSVKISVYNGLKGIREEIILPKRMVAIVENPLYNVINEPNSTLKRLVRKLAILDDIDEQAGSGKLDLIIQVPYSVRSETRKAYAEQRRKEMQEQLKDSTYGVAYADGTEKIIQLNRSLENNLLKQVEFLTSMLYSQLGITKEVMDGTADEKTMLNYHTRAIEPIISAITDEIKRKFLSKTARSQGHSIMFFKDPFKLVPVNDLAEMADKMTRNEIMTSNEVRQIIGLLPSDDPNADKLRNSNLNQPEGRDDTGGEILPEGYEDLASDSGQEIPNE